MPRNTQATLIPELEEATFSYAEMERAYTDGLEDLADKIVTLIRDSDNEITLDELVEFLEAEVGTRPMHVSMEDLLEETAVMSATTD